MGQDNMISPRLIRMARKRHKLDAIKAEKYKIAKDQKRCFEGSFCCVHGADQRRFVLPLVFLKIDIFRGLLEIAKEEYGHNGPITLPWDAFFYGTKRLDSESTYEPKSEWATMVQQAGSRTESSCDQVRALRPNPLGSLNTGGSENVISKHFSKPSNPIGEAAIWAK
ncbi:hypothetical protein RJ639_005328 [Escallonia herrerae]|uniref:Uncharacterized protein n=1 Tax=Escallonia herrerae TaxID=1293975 RepID=A0AA89ATZ9_9ASTE|nr:hypothetical protein RJ639_005328 [Escallonia herrerae]